MIKRFDNHFLFTAQETVFKVNWLKVTAGSGLFNLKNLEAEKTFALLKITNVFAMPNRYSVKAFNKVCTIFVLMKSVVIQNMQQVFHQSNL